MSKSQFPPNAKKPRRTSATPLRAAAVDVLNAWMAYMDDDEVDPLVDALRKLNQALPIDMQISADA